MKPLLLMALLAVGACARVAGPPADPLSPEQDACRVEARRAPETRQVSRQVNTFTPEMNEARLREERRIIETQALRRCLQERGLTLPGGVEIIRPR